MVDIAAYICRRGDPAGVQHRQLGGIGRGGILAAARWLFLGLGFAVVEQEVGIHIRLRQVAQRQQHIVGGRGAGEGNRHIRPAFVRIRPQ